MKFIFKPGAPNIPLSLLEAQEADEVIFFCGAGISVPSGLPNFEKLVSQVYKSLVTEPTTLEKKALNDKLYDRVLQLLEDRTSANHVRHAIIKRLSLKPGANLSLHEAILELSKTKDYKYRLITTNVDHGFKRYESTLKLQIDAAPKLPIAKPHKWQSIVHLHGIIDKVHEPEGKNLIFTSGDFGCAYLIEGWASRFITDLFSHFIVVFVGYSLNDPVMRYMMDAIAAEKRLGYSGFKRPYVIAGVELDQFLDETYTGQVEELPQFLEEKQKWIAMGIQPILYSYCGSDHSYLADTLLEWAAYSRDGLNAKTRKIKEYAIKRPLFPYEDYIEQVIDILKEKNDFNHEDITGIPSSIFKDITDPPAPIEWLPVLYEHGLLSITKQQAALYFVSKRQNLNFQVPHIITNNLWHWLLHHLESRELVNWVIEQGCFLYPTFKELIKRKIESELKPNEPYLTFWRIIISDDLSDNLDDVSAGFEIIQAIEQGMAGYQLEHIIFQFLQPKIRLKTELVLPHMENKHIVRKPYEARVVIELSDYVYKEWKEKTGYPHAYVNLLLPITEFLHKALRLWELIGQASQQSDPSFWDMPSITLHEQNYRFNVWVILIELCRDLWLVAWDLNRTLAHAILQVWKTLPYPVFRRLVMYVYTYKVDINANKALDYLLEDKGWWLWSIYVRREKFRLLNKIWPQLSSKSANRLTQAILQGPARNIFKEDLPEEALQETIDHSIWLLLCKLASYGRDLPKTAQLKLAKLKQQYPEWSLAGDEQDEFSHWMRSGRGFESDISENEFKSQSISYIVAKLLECNPYYRRGRLDVLLKICKENNQKAVQLLQYLTKSSIWNEDIWYAGLVGLANSENPSWHAIAGLLANLDTSLYADEAMRWAIAFWTKTAAKGIPANSEDEQYFWPLLNKLLDTTDQGPLTELTKQNKENGFLNKAINHPIGIITEALLERFARREIKAGGGTPKSECLAAVNKIMAGKGDAYLMGQAVLASRLYYFHAIDPTWTQSTLIPRFNCHNYPEAVAMWDSYSCASNISIELAAALKDVLFIALDQAEKLYKHATHLYQLFTFICLEYPKLYSKAEQNTGLRMINNKGLTEVAQQLWRSLSHIDDKDKDGYWKNRIKPFIQDVWPKTNDFTNTEVSNYMARICIQLNGRFANALKIINPLLMQNSMQSFYSHFIRELNEKELADKQASAVFNLIAKIFPFQQPFYFEKYLISVFKRLVKADPVIRNYPYFQKIKEYLLRYQIKVDPIED